MSTQVVFFNNASSNQILSATIEHTAGTKRHTYDLEGNALPQFGQMGAPMSFATEDDTTDKWSFSVTFKDTIHGEHKWSRTNESLEFIQSKDSGRKIIVSVSDQGGNWGDHKNGPTATVVYAHTCENWNLHT